MNKIKKIILCLTVLTFLLGFFGTNGWSQEKVFKFGDVSAYSGSAAAWGKMVNISFQIAQNDINAAGGIKVGKDRYKLEVVKYDHAYDQTVALSVIRKAIYDDKLKYMNIMGGGIIPVVNDLCQKEKVVVLGCAVGTKWIGPKYPYTWKPYHDSVDVLEVILEYAGKKYPSWRKLAGMYPDDEAGHEYADGLKGSPESLGYTVVDSVFSARDVNDFHPVLTRLLAKGVDVIDMGPTPVSQQGYIMKQARGLGFKGIFTCPDGTDFKAISEIAGVQAIEGTLVGPQYVTMPTKVGKSWAERYIKEYGSLQLWTSFSYDALLLLKAALEKAGTFDTTKVCNAMETVTVDGCLGKVSYGGKSVFGLNRSFILDVGVVQVVNGKETEVHHGYARRWRK